MQSHDECRVCYDLDTMPELRCYHYRVAGSSDPEPKPSRYLL